MKTKLILLVSATTLSCLPLFADNLSDSSNGNYSPNNSSRYDNYHNTATDVDPSLKDRGQAQNNFNQPPANLAQTDAAVAPADASSPESSQSRVNRYQQVQSPTPDQSPAYSRNQRDRDEYTTDKMNRLNHFGDLRRANKIIGEEITDDQGHKLGKVNDLALDLKNGRIVEVIMATGGMMGVDERLIAVPPSSFTCDKTMKALRLNLDKQQVANAPAFVTGDWTAATSNNQIREVYQRFGVQPYFVRHSLNGEMMDTNLNPQLSPQANHGQATTPYQDNAKVLANNTADNNLNDRAALHRHHHDMDDLHGAQRDFSLGYIASASHLMGTSAWNDQNEKLGKVANFIVDLPAGRVVEVVLASGGFLGMDRSYSAVPPQSFRWNADNTAITLDTSRDSLKSAPHFKSGQWGYASQPATITEVYSTYRVPAYFNNNQVDNTAQNVRDRSGQTLTPLDQGNSQSDIDMTAQIRKAVVADSSLSMNAKNVKIITANGHVTLRGVVNSESEKKAVCADAANVASKANVDDQLRIRNHANYESPRTSPTSTDSTESTTK